MKMLLFMVFKGEYAAISTNANNIFGSPSQGRLTFPTMQSLSFFANTSGRTSVNDF